MFMYYIDGEIIFDNTEFEENIAEVQYGGAIYFESNSGKALISNSEFKN